MATKSFLDIVEKAHGGDSNYEGDEHGGGAGHDGSGLPQKTPGNFMFAILFINNRRGVSTAPAHRNTFLHNCFSSCPFFYKPLL